MIRTEPDNLDKPGQFLKIIAIADYEEIGKGGQAVYRKRIIYIINFAFLTSLKYIIINTYTDYISKLYRLILYAYVNRYMNSLIYGCMISYTKTFKLFSETIWNK